MCPKPKLQPKPQHIPASPKPYHKSIFKPKPKPDASLSLSDMRSRSSMHVLCTESGVATGLIDPLPLLSLSLNSNLILAALIQLMAYNETATPVSSP